MINSTTERSMEEANEPMELATNDITSTRSISDLHIGNETNGSSNLTRWIWLGLKNVRNESCSGVECDEQLAWTDGTPFEGKLIFDLLKININESLQFKFLTDKKCAKLLYVNGSIEKVESSLCNQSLTTICQFICPYSSTCYEKTTSHIGGRVWLVFLVQVHIHFLNLPKCY